MNSSLLKKNKEAQVAIENDLLDTSNGSHFESASNTWLASLTLEVIGRQGKSVLRRCRHRGPLYVQKAFYPEGDECAHIYMLHPPGGMVSGDHLKVDVALQDSAHVLLTTPGAGRAYRARDNGALQKQFNHITVDSTSICEWLPLENIIFNGAQVALDTRVDIASGGRFVGWDITSLGLPAQKEAFTSGRFTQRLEVWEGGRPQIVESMNISADDESSALFDALVGMQGKPVSGMLVMGPFESQAFGEQLVEALERGYDVVDARNSAVSLDMIKPCLFGISCIGRYVVARYLGHSAEQARCVFVDYWKHFRPLLLGREICPPRIWST